MSRDLAEPLAYAIRLAQAAGEETLRYFRRPLQVTRKADGSPVSEADRATEAFLRERLAADHPGDAILGEEFGGSQEGARRLWVIDPIDGTKSFVRGVPLYAVLLALVEDGVPVVGVAHFPALGETLAAARDLGARMNGEPARVSEEGRLGEATLLVTDEGSVLKRLGSEGWLDLRRRFGLVRSWGDAYGHALVATGRAEAMLDGSLKPWDALPLIPILTEAGGVFRGWDGIANPPEGDAIASNAAIAAELARRIASARRGS